jgi:hypothetical protein
MQKDRVIAKVTEEFVKTKKGFLSRKSEWALAHPCMMKIGYHAPGRGSASADDTLIQASSPKVWPWELSGPRIVAFQHAEQSRA